MPVDWSHLKDGFHAALDLAPELRTAFVDHLGAGNPELKRELRSLLRAHQDATAFLADPTRTDPFAPSLPVSRLVPSHPGFDILRPVGEGGMGIVYLAFDKRYQAQVALKTIAKMSPASLVRFKNEFRALADVAHPNLVRLFELLGDDNVWFFSMEFVDGESFFSYVRPGTPRDTLDLQRLRVAFPQLVEAVAAIHAAGKLHCDLKPSNVLVSHADNRVVVLDFGLVTEIEAPIWAAGGDTIAGTVAFMSPEQARGVRLTEASDWYTVGVILYQALTGRLPLDHPELAVLLSMKQEVVPPAPLELDPVLPADLSELCMQLLAREPSARPRGAEILRRLDRRAGPEAAMKGRFVGREAPLALLHDALRDVRAGQARTVYVHGTSGVGKTALTTRFLRDVTDGALVLSGRCYERESVPYKALDSVIDALAVRLKSIPDAAALLHADVGHLARLFPALSQVEAVLEMASRTPVVAEVREVRRRASRALRYLLRGLAGRYLLVIAIDDLQWSDLDSTELLSTVLGAANPPRLLFLGSYRSEHATTSTVLSTLLSRHPPAVQIQVGQLSDDEVARLVRHMRGAAVTPAIIDTVIRESGGVPLFVEQLMHALDEVGDVAHGALSFESVLKRRLAALDDSSRRLLAHVAVGGQPLPRAALAEAAGLSPEQALRDLATLRSQQWIRSDGTSGEEYLEPFHDRIRESIVYGLPADELRRHHFALATALEPRQVDPEILAVHWSGCERFREASRYAALAADRAAEALAFNRAARLYEQALEWQDVDATASRELEVKLADALAHAGRSLEAGDAYLRTADRPDMSHRLFYQQRAAEQYLNHGHVEKGYQVLEDLVKAVGLRMPKRGVHAIASLAWQRLLLRIGGVVRRRSAPATDPERDQQFEVCLLVGRGLSMLEPIRGAEFQTRACRLAIRSGHPTREALAFALEAPLEAAAGYRATSRVEQLLDRSERLAAQLDDAQLLANARLMRGAAHYLRAEWLDALRYCSEAEVLLRERCVNVWWEIDRCVSFAMWTLGQLGRLGEAAVRRPLLLKEAAERGDRILRSQLMTGNNVLAPLSQRENPVQIREELMTAVQPFRGEGYHMPHVLRMLGLCEIEIYRGRGDKALAMLHEDWAPLRASLLLEVQFIHIEVLGHRWRCALAAAAGARAPAALLAEARRAARRLERIATPWAGAYAADARAQLAIAENDPRAIELVSSAAAHYDRLDMQLRAATARYRLGAIIGGIDGRALQAASVSQMQSLGILDHEGMVRLFMPIEGPLTDARAGR